jgi:sugar lactone lactonase YvrE
LKDKNKTSRFRSNETENIRIIKNDFILTVDEFSYVPLREIASFFYNMDLIKIMLKLCRLTLAEITLSPYASWNQSGVTVAGASNGAAGSSISLLNMSAGISITYNDVLYISDSNNNRVVVLNLDSITNISIIGSGPGNDTNQFNTPYDLFVTNTSLYVIDYNNHRVQKTSLDGSNPSTVPGLTGLNWPFYLYVDNNDNIYLSDTGNHRVLLFLSNSANFTMVAGTGVMGNNSNQLNFPFGLFVNQNGTIYIADCYNHRIMKWLAGASAGSIAAGDGTGGPSSTQLSSPSQIIVDKNEYMYITEYGNARVTRWAPNSSFGTCIAACIGASGINSNQLNSPVSLTFDNHGSLYVSDAGNNRVQKYQIFQYSSKY